MVFLVFFEKKSNNKVSNKKLYGGGAKPYLNSYASRQGKTNTKAVVLKYQMPARVVLSPTPVYIHKLFAKPKTLNVLARFHHEDVVFVVALLLYLLGNPPAPSFASLS